MVGGLIHARGPVCAALVLLSAGLLPCFCEEDGLPSGADVVVAQLMETHWHQRRPFNDFMPVDWPDMPKSGNAVRNETKRGRMPCGCVADAMGQILRHYEWPVRLDETVSFEHNWKNERTLGSTVTGKVLQQFDGHVPFEFSTMTNAWIAAFKDPRGMVPEINRYSVARLMFAAGVLLEMDYGTNDSSSNPYTMISKLGTWYETPEYKNCRGSFAGGRAEILAALKAGMPVAASLPGHEIVIHGYATAGGDEYVFVANDGYGSDGWERADELAINEAIVGFVPKKTVQLDPLRKVEDPTVEIRWALPRVWADAVGGFTARAVASGEAVRMVSVGKDARSCVFTGLTAGKKYSFSVTPDVAGAVASPPVEATIAGEDFPAPPWPEIQDVWSTTTNGFGETWYHENAMGRGVVYVRCSKTVRSLEAVSGNLTALPQEKVGVRSFGGGLYAVELDGSNVAAMPSSAGTSSMNRLRVIVTLAASDENGTTVYRNLMVRFSDETPKEEVQTFEDGGSEPTIADGEFVGTLAKNDAGEYVVTLADGVFGVSLENVGTNTIVVPPRTQFVVGVPVGQIRVRSGDYDVSDAFGLYGDAANGCFLSLEEGRSVTLCGETIPVVPMLAAITGDGLLPKKPFVVTETAVAFGVKAIPGLTYTLLRSDDLSTVRSGTAVDTQLAEGMRVRLQDKKGANNRVFYVIRVNADN